MAEAILATHVPVVDLRNAVSGLTFAGLGPDNRAVSKLAVEHLLDRGLRHFGFCGIRPQVNRFLDARCEHFTRLVQPDGHTCSVFQSRRRSPQTVVWEQEQDEIANWLRTLPRPVGVMTCDDDRGQQVVDACLRAGLRVPDDVAVIGVDNDEPICRLSSPPLTSVDVNAARIGYEAAALLDRMIAGEKRPRQVIELPPRGVVARASTDLLAVDDLHVGAALRFIREHACDPINVEQVLSQIPISRSTLERRFKQLLNRTPKVEILRVQLDRAKQLLSDSDLSLPMVADRSGFGSLSHFCEVFHRKVGRTPPGYRDQNRLTRER